MRAARADVAKTVEDALQRPPPSRRAIAAELLAIAAATALFLVAFRTRPGYVDAVLGLVAVALIAFGNARSRRIWAVQGPPREGYRGRVRAGFERAAWFTAPVMLVFLLVGIGLGYDAGGRGGALDRVLNWHLLAACALYVPWALLQQFVFQFYLYGRLLYLLPARAATLLTACVFCGVHFPRLPVMAVTLLAGVVWSLLYRRYRTLAPIVASHALLGSTLHYWLFGRDLFDLWLAG